jgi:hypothetical protein
MIWFRMRIERPLMFRTTAKLRQDEGTKLGGAKVKEKE